MTNVPTKIPVLVSFRLHIKTPSSQDQKILSDWFTYSHDTKSLNGKGCKRLNLHREEFCNLYMRISLDRDTLK